MKEKEIALTRQKLVYGNESCINNKSYYPKFIIPLNYVKRARHTENNAREQRVSYYISHRVLILFIVWCYCVRGCVCRESAILFTQFFYKLTCVPLTIHPSCVLSFFHHIFFVPTGAFSSTLSLPHRHHRGRARFYRFLFFSLSESRGGGEAATGWRGQKKNVEKKDIIGI